MFKQIQTNQKVKRIEAKDGSIPTHPVVAVDSDKLEATILKECLLWLKKHHIFCSRNNVGAGNLGGDRFYSYGIKGGGDIMGYLPNGIGFEIECKRGSGGRQSTGQQKRMKKVQNTNALYFIVHGVEELEYYMRGLV